jgi:Tol biopolymer transport system component
VVITPGAPVLVTSTRWVINNDSYDHADPHVSGDLASYTEGSANRSVRYFRFSTALDQAIPTPPGATDQLSDVSGSRIVFTRAFGACDRILLFDVGTASVSEVDPQPCPQRFGVGIGGNTVAYIDFSTRAGVTLASDLSSPGPGFGTVQLSSGSGTAQNPDVSLSGDVVVWEQCSSSPTTCDVMKAIRTGGTWGAATLLVPSSNNPHTDGVNVAYDSTRTGSATGRDIYFQPVAGGPETQLQITGEQSNPSISNGVICFENRASAGAPGDIFVYVIATNTLYQITSTPTIDDHLSDVSVLPNGDIRVVWASNDGLFGVYNVYATTFTPAKPNTIVFASTRDGNSEIYVMDQDGSNQKRLTNNPAFDGEPAWSPDRSKIAFVSTRDGIQQIYVMNADGSNQTRVSSSLVYDGAPAWSPDGSKIAFHTNRDGNFEIYVMNADGSNPTRLTNNPALDVFPAWSPDGTKIAFSTNRDFVLNLEIYVMNANGSNPVRLTNNPAIDFDPTWSPDGTRIAFVSTRDGSAQIYAMNADGSSPTRLTNFPTSSVQFSESSWSRGTDIAVTGKTFGNIFGTHALPPDSAIYSLHSDGTLTRLSTIPASDSSPDW